MLGTQRQVTLWGLMAGQPSPFIRLPARERPCLKNKAKQTGRQNLSKTPKFAVWLTHKNMDVRPQTRVHTQENTYTHKRGEAEEKGL